MVSARRRWWCGHQLSCGGCGVHYMCVRTCVCVHPALFTAASLSWSQPGNAGGASINCYECEVCYVFVRTGVHASCFIHGCLPVVVPARKRWWCRHPLLGVPNILCVCARACMCVCICMCMWMCTCVCVCVCVCVCLCVRVCV